MSSAVENENRLRKPQGKKEIGFGQSHKFMHGTLYRGHYCTYVGMQ